MISRLRCVLLLCAAGLVYAQGQNGPETKPWWNSQLARQLNLTPRQEQRIHFITRSYRDRLFDARNEARKAEADLRDLLNEPAINPAQAQQVIDRLADARANSTRVFTEMSLQLRSVLTLDQWQALVRRWPEMQQRRLNAPPPNR
jgi:Spy/CpxP family protein refolding chaperone